MAGIDSGVLIGNPRLRILDIDKVTVLKTLHLPYPDKDSGILITDVATKASKVALLGGGIRYTPGLVRHNVTLTYGLYDPLFISKMIGKTVGILDGSVPELTQLYTLITQFNTGRLSISPCSNQEVWYRVACTSDLTRQTVNLGAFGNISLTFEGLDAYADTTATTVIG